MIPVYMKILILDWRDPKNPKRGGAEVVMARYAQHWVSRGHQVWWLANRFPGSSATEEVNNIKVVRIGPNLPYHTTLGMLIAYPFFVLNTIWVGWGWSRKIGFDVTIDAIHGLPMYSFLFGMGRRVMFVCEVAGQIWDKMYPPPINTIGKWCEHIIYFLYAKFDIWAISDSTKRDILCIKSDLTVQVLPLGIDIDDFKPVKKFTFPSAVFVARLVKMKGIETALAAVKIITTKLPNFKLFVVGGGASDYVNRLKSQVVSDGLASNVEFVGPAPDTERNRLYAQSHFLFHPSYKEGFGLTVLEAGASGTPTIARRGSSMDELIIHGTNGLLFETENQLAQLFLEYYDSPKLSKLSTQAVVNAKRWAWPQVLAKSASITRL